MNKFILFFVCVAGLCLTDAGKGMTDKERKEAFDRIDNDNRQYHKWHFVDDPTTGRKETIYTGLDGSHPTKDPNYHKRQYFKNLPFNGDPQMMINIYVEKAIRLIYAKTAWDAQQLRQYLFRKKTNLFGTATKEPSELLKDLHKVGKTYVLKKVLGNANVPALKIKLYNEDQKMRKAKKYTPFEKRDQQPQSRWAKVKSAFGRKK